MKLVQVAALLLLVNIPRTALAGGVPSYELPEFVPVGSLFANDDGDLVVTFTTRRDGKSESHFWNADKRRELPDVDPEKIAHDKAEYEAAIARNHLTRLELGIRGKMTLASGSVVSGEWLDTPGNCQWFYHSYIKVRPVDGQEKAFAFLIRRPAHSKDLVYNCPGVGGASFLNVSFDDGSPLFYRRPGGGFYAVVQGMPYAIGFTDDGATDFSPGKTPLAMVPEDLVAAAYTAMASGRMTPQMALDNLVAAIPAFRR
jgi:hypothetical protein